MSAGLNTRQSSAAIVQAIAAAVSNVRLPDGSWGAATPSITLALGRVESFDAENLVEAFRYLLVTEQRVGVVVPMAERFEPVYAAQKLTIKRELPVMVLISDRVLGSRKAALEGNNDTPGALNLVEMVLPVLCGILMPAGNGAAAVVIEPVDAAVLTVADTEKELPNRVCVGLQVRCRGGVIEAGMPRGGVL